MNDNLSLLIGDTIFESQEQVKAVILNENDTFDLLNNFFSYNLFILIPPQ